SGPGRDHRRSRGCTTGGAGGRRRRRPAAGRGWRHGPGQRARAAGPAFRWAGLAAPAGRSRGRGGGADRRGLRRVAGGGTEGGIAMTMGRLTGLVAEDEAPQRRALVEQLQQVWPALELVAVCDDGEAALQAVAEHRSEERRVGKEGRWWVAA